MKKFLLGMGVITCLLMTACGSGMKVEMDNPTAEKITVKIDGKKEYTLNPMELKEVTGLKKGEHTMTVNDGSEIKFNLENSALINPTLSLYVIAEQEYGSGYADDSKWVDVVIDGKECWGPFNVIENTPVIETSNLNHGVLSSFGEEIETYKTGTVVLTKIFRKDDFLKFYEKDYE